MYLVLRMFKYIFTVKHSKIMKMHHSGFDLPDDQSTIVFNVIFLFVLKENIIFFIW